MSDIESDQLLCVPIRDYFGRELGKVICYSHDGKGDIRTILATLTNGDIVEYPREDLQISSSEVVVKDKLMVSAHALRKEIEINLKKMQMLEELKRASKIHTRVYTELKDDLEKEKSSLEERKKELSAIADARRMEVAKNLMALEKIRVNVEIQAMSGEIRESIYRYASSEVKSAIDKLTNELELLERELSFLDVEIDELVREMPILHENEVKEEPAGSTEPSKPEGAEETEETERQPSADKPIRVRLV